MLVMILQDTTMTRDYEDMTMVLMILILMILILKETPMTRDIEVTDTERNKY